MQQPWTIEHYPYTFSKLNYNVNAINYNVAMMQKSKMEFKSVTIFNQFNKTCY